MSTRGTRCTLSLVRAAMRARDGSCARWLHRSFARVGGRRTAPRTYCLAAASCISPPRDFAVCSLNQKQSRLQSESRRSRSPSEATQWSRSPSEASQPSRSPSEARTIEPTERSPPESKRMRPNVRVRVVRDLCLSCGARRSATPRTLSLVRSLRCARATLHAHDGFIEALRMRRGARNGASHVLLGGRPHARDFAVPVPDVRAEALAEGSVALAQAMVPQALALARGGG